MNEHGEELMNRLRMLRERANLTQEEVATALGGSRHQVVRIENGRFPAHLELLAMLALYEVTDEELTSCLAMWELAWQRDRRRIHGKQLGRSASQ